MYITIVLIVVFGACFASLMNNGLWSNTLTLINVLLAALLATNYFEPFANLIERSVDASYTYVYDFLALWLIFGFAMVALRSVTDYLSLVRVRFFVPVEKVGGLVMAIWASWIVVCFTTMTLHAAPLSRNFLGGSFQPSPEDKMLVVGPDRVWLGWANRESRGPLSRFGKTNAFDPSGDYILRYGARRGEFENMTSLSKAGAKGASGAKK